MADIGVETTMNIIETLRSRVKKERVTDPSSIKFYAYRGNIRNIKR